MLRKYVLPAIALLVIITLFVLYRGQHRLYRKTLQANYTLVTRLNELRQKDQQMEQGMQQIQQANQDAPALHATFIDRRKYYRQNWENYIHVSLNDYKTGFLGGVKDVRVTVSNGTEFPLDNVTAQLSYYRATGKLFKTEQVSLLNVAAGASKSVRAPDSRKGMKVSLRLERITSQQMNFCWSASRKPAPGDEDPWECASTGDGKPVE
jgi:hypothetical protein